MLFFVHAFFFQPMSPPRVGGHVVHAVSYRVVSYDVVFFRLVLLRIFACAIMQYRDVAEGIIPHYMEDSIIVPELAFCIFFAVALVLQRVTRRCLQKRYVTMCREMLRLVVVAWGTCC